MLDELDVDDPIETLPQTQKESNELFDFLFDLKLEKYEQSLKENGILTLNDLRQVDPGRLDSFGFPLGHKLKIVKKLKEK